MVALSIVDYKLPTCTYKLLTYNLLTPDLYLQTPDLTLADSWLHTPDLSEKHQVCQSQESACPKNDVCEKHQKGFIFKFIFSRWIFMHFQMVQKFWWI